MFPQQGVQGPVAPWQYGPAQVAGPQAPFAPMQVAGAAAYYPTQATDWTAMFSAMMPMIMMIMMVVIMKPMLAGVTTS